MRMHSLPSWFKSGCLRDGSSKMSVGRVIPLVAVFGFLGTDSVAAPAIATQATPTSGLYKLEDKITFNVMDAVAHDPASGQVTLLGHSDPRYGDARIPYLQLLATLLESPRPEFSLNWTTASEAQVDAWLRRLDDDKELVRMVSQWGRPFDANGDVTVSGRYFLPLLGIKPPSGSWKDLDQFGKIAATYRAVGNQKAAQTIELYGRLQRAVQNGSDSPPPEFGPALFALLAVTGKMDEVVALRRRNQRGELSAVDQLDASFRLLAESLDSGLGLRGNPTAAAYSKARARGLTPSKAYDNGVVPEVNNQLQTVLRDVLETLYHRVDEFQVPPEVLAATTGMPRFEVVPRYDGIDRHSQLARVFFESDYLGKSLTNKPELARTIPDYQTTFAFERNHACGRANRSRFRLWFTIDGIDLGSSPDGKIVATKAARMKINIRAIPDTDTAGNRCLQQYGELLTTYYDEFAAQFPIMHELREAAKLAGAAGWLRSRQPDLRLPQQGRASWRGADRVPGLLFVAWSPREPRSGAPVMAATAEGGISFASIPTRVIPRDASDAMVSSDFIANGGLPDTIVPTPPNAISIAWIKEGKTARGQPQQAVTVSTRMPNIADTEVSAASPKGFTVLWQRAPAGGSTSSFQQLQSAASSAHQPMPERAAELVAALDEISNLPIFLNQRSGRSESPLPKGRPVDQRLVDNNCQTFFRALGGELARRGLQSWSDDFPLGHIGEPMADGIVVEIEKNAGEGRAWKKIQNWEEAQRLANDGAIVIGGLRADPPHGRNHGHIAIVFPMPPGMDLAEFNAAGRGPFVRDGNEHLYEVKDPQTNEKTGEKRFHPSTWGAIRASRAMPLAQTSWFLWTPLTR